jgi:hypothetical protein
MSRSSRDLTLVQALLELHCLVRESCVAQALHLWLEGADQRDELGQSPDLLALAGAQDLRKHAHEGTILPAGEGLEPPPGLGDEMGLRAADLVFDPTLACREGDAPVPAAERRAATPNGTVLARIASSPPAPDSRGRSGQGLPLSRTMLSDHKSPYVGRFACDWPRLSTTDPHAARPHPTPGRPAYCPGTFEPAEPEALPVLAGVAPLSTIRSRASAMTMPKGMDGRINGNVVIRARNQH